MIQYSLLHYTKVRDRIVAAGRAHPNHLLAESGWVSFYIREPADVDKAIELLQESYAMAAKQKALRDDDLTAGPHATRVAEV